MNDTDPDKWIITKLSTSWWLFPPTGLGWGRATHGTFDEVVDDFRFQTSYPYKEEL